MRYILSEDPQLASFLQGKSGQTIDLLDHFLAEFLAVGEITLHPAKTMIGIANGTKRIAWITQLGKQFIHIVFPFKQPYENNLCFQKIAQVPGDAMQFNHHFRMFSKDDINDEMRGFMRKAFQNEK